MTDEAPGRLSEERQRPENSWTVSTTAMTQPEAEQAAALIEGQFSEVFVQAIDPRSFLTLHLDRWTAEAVREALRRLVAAGGDVGNLTQDFDEFLAHAHPYVEGEDPWPGVI
jgi:hypothetical protein